MLEFGSEQGRINMPVFRNHYAPPDYVIDTVNLTFDVRDDHVLVTGIMNYRQNSNIRNAPLVLNGKDLQILSFQLNNNELSANDIKISEEIEGQLYSIANVPAIGVLIVQTRLDPWRNASCVGLYMSKDILVTKCESEYFRRIIPYIDRPDNLAKFTTTIIANETNFPVLLSNGNKVEEQKLTNGRHMVKFVDPFPKPSYLFALVAGDLGYIADQYTSSLEPNKVINLFVYTQKHNLNRITLAMQALKEAMAWEEQNYGLIYDLDNCYLVGVQNYNAGATENKGLLIFNDSLLLSEPKLSTDENQKDIYATIAHELMHNYAGNRVTIRSANF